jgi:hypothetical protein
MVVEEYMEIQIPIKKSHIYVAFFDEQGPHLG